MANNDILQYLRKTPHNTNVNVVKGMIGNEGGRAIEMETVFEDDIVFTYRAGHDTYYNATGNYSTINSIKVPYGYLWITLDDIVMIGACLSIDIDNLGQCGFECYSKSFYLSSDSIKSYINLSNTYYEDERYIDNNGLYITIYKNIADEAPDLQAYCQTPHHLKIEWFTI